LRIIKLMKIIAEVKTDSPFGWHSDKTWDELFRVANEIGDIISIHTDQRWHGSFDLIKKARKLTKKPILAKGIHEDDSDIEKAVSLGADYVLVVGRIPKCYLDMCLIEPYTLAELQRLPINLKAVWNSRDLKSGGLKKETFSEARKAFAGWLCQASNIRTVEDIDKSADAALVGTNLIEFAKSLRT
jgi:indole-3-glycerol phosphate synthase